MGERKESKKERVKHGGNYCCILQSAAEKDAKKISYLFYLFVSSGIRIQAGLKKILNIKKNKHSILSDAALKYKQTMHFEKKNCSILSRAAFKHNACAKLARKKIIAYFRALHLNRLICLA